MSRKRVFLGLDAPALATAMSVLANDKKFEVLVAERGDGAVRGAVEEAPDMAILDTGLGWDACCKRLREEVSPATLVVFLVSADHRGDIGRCLDGRCDAIIVKPLTYEGLSSLLTRLLFPETKGVSRFQVRVPVRYGTDPDSLTENHSVDLTAHGMFIQTGDVMPVGTTLYLVFTLDAGPAVTIRCTARVAWVNDPIRHRASVHPSGMGLEFMHLAPLHANAVREFLFSQRWGGTNGDGNNPARYPRV
ncbi:MAG TPA: PilZ domain-containing protein [Geobacteraceae bacterium]